MNLKLLQLHNFETQCHFYIISTQIWEALKRLEADSRYLSWCFWRWQASQWDCGKISIKKKQPLKTDIFHHFWTLTPTDFVTILWVTPVTLPKVGTFLRIFSRSRFGWQAAASSLSRWTCGAIERGETRPNRWGGHFLMGFLKFFFVVGQFGFFSRPFGRLVFMDGGHLKLYFFPQQLTTNVSWKE